MQLNLAYTEIGFKYLDREKWAEAIQSFENARKTLKGMATNHAKLVSSMVAVYGALAEVDENLREACDSDRARYALPRRAVIREAYEICEKLSLVEPLSWNLRIIYARQCFEMVCYQEEDGEKPDLELLRKAERLWVGMHSDSPTGDEPPTRLVIVRLKLADVLADRGEYDEASRWRRQALTTARGNPDRLYEIAVHYASRCAAVGLYPTKLDPPQEQARRRQFAHNAVAMLREAVADGFHDSKQLRDESALAPLRATPEFQAIISDLEFPDEAFARP